MPRILHCSRFTPAVFSYRTVFLYLDEGSFGESVPVQSDSPEPKNEIANKKLEEQKTEQETEGLLSSLYNQVRQSDTFKPYFEAIESALSFIQNNTYDVQEGDTLWQIMQDKCPGITPDQLVAAFQVMKKDKFNPNRIYADRDLIGITRAPDGKIVFQLVHKGRNRKGETVFKPYQMTINLSDQASQQPAVVPKKPKRGVVSRYSDGSFRPSNQINRPETIKQPDPRAQETERQKQEAEKIRADFTSPEITFLQNNTKGILGRISTAQLDTSFSDATGDFKMWINGKELVVRGTELTGQRGQAQKTWEFYEKLKKYEKDLTKVLNILKQ